MGVRVTIIGAGPGGYAAAVRAAQLGAEVTLVEEAEVGGTCLHWGCIPTKVMRAAAELRERLETAADFGIRLSEIPKVDLRALAERKRSVVRTQTDGILKLLAHHRVRLLRGAGFAEAPGLVIVRTPAGETLELPGDRLILALGSRPADLRVLPRDGQQVLSSNDALELDVLPESLAIVGGGVIGSEFACLFSALGSRVTLIEAQPRLIPLPSVDEDSSRVLQREMKKRRIALFLGRTVAELTAAGERLRLSLIPASAEGAGGGSAPKPETVEADRVLVCVGRAPLAGAGPRGIRMAEGGWIRVNEHLETSVPGVFAIGDALGPGRPMLAHLATAEGRLAAENALGSHRAMQYDVVPGAIFTLPEVAGVGLTEQAARRQGLRVRADTVLFRSLAKPLVIGRIAGQAKIISDTESGRILGVHLVGAHATDLIAEASLALRQGCTVEDLAETIHAHPTLAEVMQETALKALDRPLHG